MGRLRWKVDSEECINAALVLIIAPKGMSYAMIKEE